MTVRLWFLLLKNMLNSCELLNQSAGKIFFCEAITLDMPKAVIEIDSNLYIEILNHMFSLLFLQKLFTKPVDNSVDNL